MTRTTTMRLSRVMRLVLAGMGGVILFNVHLYWKLNQNQIGASRKDGAGNLLAKLAPRPNAKTNEVNPASRKTTVVNKETKKDRRQLGGQRNSAETQVTGTKTAPKQSKTAVIPDANAKQVKQEHRIAGLNCERFTGGPPTNASVVKDVTYWRDIPSDASYVSPFAARDDEPARYLTFEPDEGGWNNLRIGLETVIALAYATGRTLVLPPTHRYPLYDNTKKTVYSISDFYHLPSIAKEIKGLKFIKFQDFLEKEVMTGQLRDPQTHQPTFPPDNRTMWNGRISSTQSVRNGDGARLWLWLRNVTTPLAWNWEKCVAAFPSAPGADGVATLQQVLAEELPRQHSKYFYDSPTPVDADPVGRLSEILSQRKKLCIYDETMQAAKIVHAKGEQVSNQRMLVPFYAFLYFHDWKTDLIVKRFVRDHLRYVDEIQCAAARLLQAIRDRAWREHNTTSFDAIHLRRNDFQGFFAGTALTAEQYYTNNTHDMLQDGRVVYVATDEKDRNFFAPLARHYHLYFLNDFKDVLAGLDPNYVGMIEQLVAAQSDTFVGSYYSTFTAYINRVRGYLTEQRYKRQHLAAPSSGVIASYYFGLSGWDGTKNFMQRYSSVQDPFWAREFPVAWRDIDRNVAYDS